jgi:hypothetical protein
MKRGTKDENQGLREREEEKGLKQSQSTTPLIKKPKKSQSKTKLNFVNNNFMPSFTISDDLLSTDRLILSSLQSGLYSSDLLNENSESILKKVEQDVKALFLQNKKPNISKKNQQQQNQDDNQLNLKLPKIPSKKYLKY